MSSKKLAAKERMHIVDAIDHLSSMAELDTQSSREDLIAQGLKTKLLLLKELKPAERERVLSLVKTAFRTVHRYLKHIYHKDDSELKEVELQQGVQAIMSLAKEGVEKLSLHSSLFHYTYREGKIKEIKEYVELEKFYLGSIKKKFKELLTTEEEWETQWEGGDLHLNIEKIGLKDLEAVKRDRQYELFSIRQEDGSSFFPRNLLRHIKLVSDFDQLVSDLEGEDPLLAIHLLNSEQAQYMAEEIKEAVKEELEVFYLDAKANRKSPLVLAVKRLIMPLILASSKKNLLLEAAGKSCAIYLRDFHRFLRALIKSNEYQNLLEYELSEMDEVNRKLVQLIGSLCRAFFVVTIEKGKWTAYIEELVKRGYQKVPPKQRRAALAPKTFCQTLLDSHDSIEQLLKKYPNGPLFKAMDLFREKGEAEGFDPLAQGNFPYFLYTVSSKQFSSNCLHVPCPTWHRKINSAEIIEEFKGYLRFLAQKKKEKPYLFINLQDPTSWQEHIRCQALHELAGEKEFAKTLIVATLPKRGEFYYQTDIYADMEEAELFLAALESQLNSQEACGFFFSAAIKKKELFSFISRLITKMHQLFFEEKKRLSRKERLDFIEIFYLFLSLKLLDMTKAPYFSFSCKDGIDVGGSMSGGFFAFLLLLSRRQKWTVEHQKELLFLFFGPALMIRERLIDDRRLQRAISALFVVIEAIKKEKTAFFSAIKPLYSASLFSSLDM